MEYLLAQKENTGCIYCTLSYVNLLDYVSPVQLNSFWLAVNYGMVSVIAAIIGFVCFKLIVHMMKPS